MGGGGGGVAESTQHLYLCYFMSYHHQNCHAKGTKDTLNKKADLPINKI